MGLIVKKRKASSIPPIDAGTYPAVCIGVVDLGQQHSEKFNNYTEKILFIWEIPSQTVEVDGEAKPRWLSQEFSATLNEKGNLAKMLVSWRGKTFTDQELDDSGDGFNLTQMLGAGCLLQVIVDEKETGTYNRISAVIGLPVGMPPVAPVSELMAFDIEAWDETALEKLPEWVQDRIKRSMQYQKMHVPTDPVDFPLDQPRAAMHEPPCAAEVSGQPSREVCPI